MQQSVGRVPPTEATPAAVDVVQPAPGRGRVEDIEDQ